MESKKYYQEVLYPLQDKVLNALQQTDSEFYLTGGTALSRFYLHHRYSDDLDFFTNRDGNFADATKSILKMVSEHVGSVRVQLADTDFLRAFVVSDNAELKLEFINDVSSHYLNVINKSGWNLDNWENILSNKISAISRDAAKDYVDILFLSLSYQFDWVALFDAAKQKDAWVNEVTVAEAIDAFDVERLRNISWINKPLDINISKAAFHKIAEDILKASDNSLSE